MSISRQLEQQPLLTVDKLSVHFRLQGGGRSLIRAVDGVDLDIAGGEAVGVVGESGCGKSTLARTIVGLHEPAGGHFSWKGKPISSADLKKLREHIQYVFQDPASSLNPRLRVGTQVSEPLRGFGKTITRDDRLHQAAELLESVGLPADFIKRYPHQLSGGQRQRVAIARALAIKPELLVADEPLASLDVTAQAGIIDLLKSLRADYCFAMLLISHDLSVIHSLTKRVYVFYYGRVVEAGRTSDILADAKHPYTQALLAAVPRLDKKSGEKKIVLGGDPPGHRNPPAGCAFNTRCPHVFERCRLQRPELKTADDGRSVACFLHHQV